MVFNCRFSTSSESVLGHKYMVKIWKEGGVYLLWMKKDTAGLLIPLTSPEWGVEMELLFSKKRERSSNNSLGNGNRLRIHSARCKMWRYKIWLEWSGWYFRLKKVIFGASGQNCFRINCFYVTNYVQEFSKKSTSRAKSDSLRIINSIIHAL